MQHPGCFWEGGARLVSTSPYTPWSPAELSILMKLLDSEDELLAGNAALCLGNCMEVPQAASSLLKTDVVRVLLRLVGNDSTKAAVQLNAGIALGKLCTAEPR